MIGEGRVIVAVSPKSKWTEDELLGKHILILEPITKSLVHEGYENVKFIVIGKDYKKNPLGWDYANSIRTVPIGKEVDNPTSRGLPYGSLHKRKIRRRART